ncbi:MAG: hypothetical protein Q7S53_04685 [bacterium]|nr:hypothetical protein [bacterium]
MAAITENNAVRIFRRAEKISKALEALLEEEKSKPYPNKVTEEELRPLMEKLEGVATQARHLTNKHRPMLKFNREAFRQILL